MPLLLLSWTIWQSWVGSAGRKRSAISAAKFEDRHLIATDPAPEPGSVHQILRSDKRTDSTPYNVADSCRSRPRNRSYQVYAACMTIWGCHVTEPLRPDLHYEIPIPPPMRSCAVVSRPSTSRALLRRRMSARGYERLRRKLYVYSSRRHVNDCGSFISQLCTQSDYMRA